MALFVTKFGGTEGLTSNSAIIWHSTDRFMMLYTEGSTPTALNNRVESGTTAKPSYISTIAVASNNNTVTITLAQGRYIYTKVASSALTNIEEILDSDGTAQISTTGTHEIIVLRKIS